MVRLIEPHIEAAQAMEHIGPFAAQVYREIPGDKTDLRVQFAESLEGAFLGRPQRPTRLVSPFGSHEQSDLARREDPAVEARMDRIGLVQGVS